jgi:tRNA threonylcarbamoyladenosine biosynthesis protein TsaE
VTVRAAGRLCADPAATREMAAELAAELRPGDVLLLEGDLGAGKTTFVQGLASALGVTTPVTSPTFTLVNVYPTKKGFPLVHVDVYRLERLSEVEDLALGELIDDGAAVAVEWGERAAAALPPARFRVRLEHAGASGGRRVTVEE